MSVLREEKREELYRVYVTEVLRCISRGAGYEIKLNYAEFIQKLTETQPEPEAADDIISRIKSKVEAVK